MKTQLTLMCLLLSPLLASADETWETASGRVIYLEDIEDVAVWQAETLDGTLHFYIEGLVGKLNDRSVHDGYWIEDTDRSCGATLTGPDGHTGANWGRLKLIFHAREFPTDWTMVMGSCFEDPSRALQGKSPLTP